MRSRDADVDDDAAALVQNLKDFPRPSKFVGDLRGDFPKVR